MDKYDFMSVVDDTFDECKSAQELSIRFREMQDILRQAYIMKLGYKTSMGEFESNK